MFGIYGRTVCGHGSEMEEELSPACLAWKKELQQDLESVQTVGDFAFQRNHTQFVNPGLGNRWKPYLLASWPLAR
jgi:hypothetical protein